MSEHELNSRSTAERRKKRGLKLALLVLGMVGFAFLNIPLFKVFCAHYGLFGATSTQVAATTGAVDAHRTINVLFTGTTAAGLDVRLEPQDSLQYVHPNQRQENKFTFVNLTDHPVRFRAIHSIFPASAATHLALIQCFCFSDQTLAPHATKTLPVIYQMNRGLDPLVSRVSLMYTLEPLAPATPPATSPGEASGGQ